MLGIDRLTKRRFYGSIQALPTQEVLLFSAKFSPFSRGSQRGSVLDFACPVVILEDITGYAKYIKSQTLTSEKDIGNVGQSTEKLLA